MLVMVFLNVAAAFVIRTAVSSGERFEVEHQGRIVVSSWFLQAAKTAELSSEEAGKVDDQALDANYYRSESRDIADNYGGTRAAIEQKLRNAIRNHGTRDFVGEQDTSFGLTAFPRAGRFPAMLGSVMLILWGVMLVFQGEGLELDLQRRRHPCGNGCFLTLCRPGQFFWRRCCRRSLPIPSFGRTFVCGICVRLYLRRGTGFSGNAVARHTGDNRGGVPGKGARDRCDAASSAAFRGAMIGLMSWMGYATMMLFFSGRVRCRSGRHGDGKLSLFFHRSAVAVVATISRRAGGRFVFFPVRGARVLDRCGHHHSRRGAVQRVGGATGPQRQPGPSGFRTFPVGQGRNPLGKDPLYRKEFLWFIRDRSAIVQTILIPMTVASFQIFNLRRVLSHAQAHGLSLRRGHPVWNLFPLDSGSKSLSSEGTASGLL